MTADLLQRIRAACPSFTGYHLGQLTSFLEGDPDRRFFQPQLDALLQTDLDDDDRFRVRYSRFFGARRLKDYEAMRRFGEDLRREHATIPVSWVLYAEGVYVGQTGVPALRQALRHAQFAVTKCPEISGAYAHVVDVALALYERELDTKARDNLLAIAEANVEQALDRRPDYPKYLAFRARVRAQRGLFDDAMRDVTNAIDFESPNAADYAVRVSDYQAVKIEIQYKKYGEALRVRQESALREVEGARREVLQLLGLLAAIIAFLVTGIQVGQKNVAIRDNLRLIITTGGVIILVFTVFTVNFGIRRYKRLLPSLVLGLILLIGPLFWFPAVK